jgi:hypothetical protein
MRAVADLAGLNGKAAAMMTLTYQPTNGPLQTAAFG